MNPSEEYSRQVFLNCPFDKEYRKLREAIIFTILATGFVVRCALEKADSSETRITKISEIIRQSKFGLHDVSRVELDVENNLPRFNMPLELGLFLGAKYFGDSRQKEKECLILDTERYRFQKFISDIAGQDIKGHENSEEKVITAVRGWLTTASNQSLPGQAELSRIYGEFRVELPALLAKIRLREEEMVYFDFVDVCSEWLRKRSAAETASQTTS